MELLVAISTYLENEISLDQRALIWLQNATERRKTEDPRL